MPHQTEPNANNALAVLLRGMLSESTVRPETTQMFPDYPGRHADVLITALGSSPVTVEAEYEPGPEVEQDARERLGLSVVNEPRPIEAAIALKYPEDVDSAYDLGQAIADAQLSYCVLYDDGTRFPQSGWLTGSVTDLADLVGLVSVPTKAVDQAAEALERGIERAAAQLNTMAELRPNITPTIARLLGMSDVPQTRRMACAIVANALVFHQRIAGMYDDVRHLGLVCGPGVANPQQEVLSAWTDILKINYWPIFAIARDILGQLPAGDASLILAALRDTAQEIDVAGVNNAHDLTGRIFQRLIADRKYLATFYTLPASAALLARLAVSKMEGVDWSDADAIGTLRIADFACGTGALLSAVYEQVAARHERAGCDPAHLHPAMMEEVLYGCDVMPSAIHITGSTLSGAQPNIGFGQSRLYTMPYGHQSDCTVKIGSLELLQSSAVQTLFNTSDPALRTGSVGEETAAQVQVDVADEGFDLVIMNPPFTRAGSDWEGSSRSEDYVKQFRGLATDLDTQKAMAKALRNRTKGTCYHGYAGIASAFVALAHRKLKPGGVIALVLPLSAAAGLSWKAVRQMLAEDYTDLDVLSIAANGPDMAFSSDTGMAECLVIARKQMAAAEAKIVRFASLRRRPRGFAEADAIAKNITNETAIRDIADGPYGGTNLLVGDDVTGAMLTGTLSSGGENWGGVRLDDFALAQTAYALSRSELWLPGQSEPFPIPIVLLSEIGNRGWHDINIAGAKAPFTKIAASQTATYPCLWSHDAKKETRMVCEPDSQLQVRQGMEVKVVEVWATASRAHISRGFRFNSQPLAVAFTKSECIGGRAWPNVRFQDPRFDYAVSVWSNGTLGMLMYWWHSNIQVAGRGDMSITAIESLPILDFRTLTDDQLATAEAIFDEFRELDLKPAYLADADPSRAVLDRRVVCDLLGFDDDTYRAVRQLAAKWCAEPSVHGGKKRPPGAKLVM